MPNEFLRRFGIEQCRLGVFVLLRFDNIADVETVAQGSRVAPAVARQLVGEVTVCKRNLTGMLHFINHIYLLTY